MILERRPSHLSSEQNPETLVLPFDMTIFFGIRTYTEFLHFKQ